MKVVINNCFGGFSISRKAAEYMESLGDLQAKAELDEWRKKKEWFDYFKKNGAFPADAPESETKYLEIDLKYNSEPHFHGYGYGSGFRDGYPRDSSTLIAAVEKLGKEASGDHLALVLVELPDGVEWQIEEYDGNEHIAEKHRTWS